MTPEPSLGDAADDLSGRRLGPFQVHERIGVGGMGEVYRARDTRLARDVAIKILHRSVTGDPQRLARFEREARVLASLNHPHVGAIYGLEDADGTCALVLELVEGDTLAERIARGPLPLLDALNFARQIADALETAHELGIIHRDLKPANLKITAAGVVKVLDFGLAKAAEGDGSSSDLSQSPTITSARTREGVILGTPAYMSPEQARGRPVDKRTDIWAFGCILYEMLTGRLAFQGETVSDTIAAVLEREPIWPVLPASTPARIRHLLERCLEKDARRRLRDIGEARLDIETTIDDLKAPAPAPVAATPGPASPSGAGASASRRGLWFAAAGLVLVLSASLAWWMIRAPHGAAPLSVVPLTTLPGVERHPSFSPDGNHVAFTWNGTRQDNPDVYVQQIGSGSPLRLTTDPANDYSPAWSPDGRWIAFLRAQGQSGTEELRLVPPLGGPERRLASIQLRGELLLSVSIAWCPDSTCLLITDSLGGGMPDAIFAISLASGEKTQLTHPLFPVIADIGPSVSPDGRWLVFSRNITPLNGVLHRVALGPGLMPTGEPSPLSLGSLSGRDAAWMPDSERIVFSAMGALWTITVPGKNTPLRVPFAGEDGMMPAVSGGMNGQSPRLVYVRSYQDQNIWRVDTSEPGAPATSAPYVAIASTKADLTPQFSPDGKRVAFTSARSGTLEIWTADPDGANAVQLSSLGAVTGFPRWSPDGNAVVFHADPTGHGEAFLVPAAGGTARALTSGEGSTFPNLSPDGQWVYVSARGSGGGPVIWRMPFAGGERVPVTTRRAILGLLSPDGLNLYYNETFDRPSALWRRSLSTGVEIKLLDGVVRSNFAVLDHGIYYIDQPAQRSGPNPKEPSVGEARLQYFDFSTNSSRTIAQNLGNVWLGLTASPDGRTILYTRTDSSIDDLMLVENFR